jgi:uncharacterized protein
MQIIPIKNKFIKSNINIIILSLVITTLFINSIAYLLKNTFLNTEILNFALLSMQQGVLVLWIYYFIKKGVIKNIKKIFVIPKTTLLIAEILKTYLYLFAFGILLGVLKHSFGVEVPGFSEQKNILALFPSTGILFYFTIINATLFAPIIEEVVFRGALLKNLCEKYSDTTSVILSSIVFSLIHFQPEVFGAIFVISILLSRLFLKTNSLIAPILFHIINNLLKTIISL